MRRAPHARRQGRRGQWESPVLLVELRDGKRSAAAGVIEVATSDEPDPGLLELRDGPLPMSPGLLELRDGPKSEE